MTATVQISFVAVGDQSSGAPVESVKKVYSAQTFTPTTVNQQTTAACPAGVRFARVSAANCGVLVSFGPASMNNGAGPRANDPGALYIPTGAPPMIVVVSPGDKAAVVLVTGG